VQPKLSKKKLKRLPFAGLINAVRSMGIHEIISRTLEGLNLRSRVNKLGHEQSEASLIVLDQQLHYLPKKSSKNTGSCITRIMLADHSASYLAKVARELVPVGINKIEIYLPPAEFLATPYQLNISNSKLLKSALKLQQITFLPGFEEDLLLSVNEESSEKSAAGVALWLRAERMQALESAFEEQGLSVQVVRPRPLVGLLQEQQMLCVDIDSVQKTLLYYDKGHIVQWQSKAIQDSSNIHMHEEWESWQSNIQKKVKGSLDQRTQESYTQITEDKSEKSFCFLGVAAQEKAAFIVNGWIQRRLIQIFAALTVMIILPFLGNSVQLYLLEKKIAQLQEESAEARASQNEVLFLEEYWSAMSTYPRQDITSTLQALNTLITDSLSSFTLNRGVVDISGYSQNPALLIQQLAQNPQFANVGQSRSSSGSSGERGDRFGIRMNLRDIDFNRWDAEHPQLQR
jgi:hypothetical protein